MAGTARNTTQLKGSLNLLTTETDEIPKFCINGVAVGDGAAYTIVEVTSDYIMQSKDDLIFVDGNATITLVDPATARIHVTIRNISGTTAIVSTAGTTEITNLSPTQSTTLAPRPTGWFQI